MAPALALAAVLVFTAFGGAVADPAATEPGASCPAGPASPDANADATAMMRAMIEQDAQAAGEPDGDSIVLNNRGYNYGPPSGVRFDPLLVDRAADPNAASAQ